MFTLVRVRDEWVNKITVLRDTLLFKNFYSFRKSWEHAFLWKTKTANDQL